MCPAVAGPILHKALTVLSKKTEHHGGDHAVRVVPICPELRELLDVARQLAAPGEMLIVPRCAPPRFNPRTHLERLVAKSGHKIWPRLVQNLRASCETDWVQRYPAHDVAKWLGHSPKVAVQHYLMSRDHHFKDVVDGGITTVTGTGLAGLPPADSCSADCSAVDVQIAVQQASAPDSTRPHETREPAATTRVTAGSAGITPIARTGGVGSTGLEQLLFHPGKQGGASGCDAKCDAISANRIELLTRAVILVAGMAIPDSERAAVLARVVADLSAPAMRQPDGWGRGPTPPPG